MESTQKVYALCSSNRPCDDYMLPYIFSDKNYALQKASKIVETTHQHIWVEEHVVSDRGYIEVIQDSTTRTAIYSDF